LMMRILGASIGIPDLEMTITLVAFVITAVALASCCSIWALDARKWWQFTVESS